jgi:hypothetical protein
MSSGELSERARSSRARAATLGRWWPALLVLALAWVAWVNTPGACALEESAWRDADAYLTRLMIRAHRPPAFAARGNQPAGPMPSVEQQAYALHGTGAATELLRAKQELESSLSELRMCRQGSGSSASAAEH